MLLPQVGVYILAHTEYLETSTVMVKEMHFVLILRVVNGLIMKMVDDGLNRSTWCTHSGSRIKAQKVDRDDKMDLVCTDDTGRKWKATANDEGGFDF